MFQVRYQSAKFLMQNCLYPNSTVVRKTAAGVNTGQLMIKLYNLIGGSARVHQFVVGHSSNSLTVVNLF